MPRHIEIVRFACGLTADTRSVLEHAYDVAVQENLNNGGMLKSGYFHFSEFYKLWPEVLPEEYISTTSKEFLNVIDGKILKEFEWEEEIIIPCRHYVFKNLRQPFSNNLMLKSNSSQSFPEECAIIVSNNEELLTTLDILQQIVERQKDKILVNWLKMSRIETSIKCVPVRRLLHLLQERMDECYKGDKKFTRSCIDAFEKVEGEDAILTHMKEITGRVFGCAKKK